MSATLYSGPGKLFFNAKGLFPEGQDAQLRLGVDQGSDEVASAMTGHVDYTTGDVTIPIDFTPFDNWGLLATLYPAAITTPAIGTIVGGAGADVAAKVWTPDGRLYNIHAASMFKHPDMYLGTGKALFGAAQLLGILKTGGAVGTADSFYALTTGAADPGGAFAMSDFVRERWTGAWGTAAGWGGDAGAALEAEDEFTIQFKVNWKLLKVQKLTRAMQLTSVEIMCKFRPYGPTQAQIDSALLIQASGGNLGRRLSSNGADLVLTSAVAGKTVTIKNCSPLNAGYDFGGNKLGNGEMAFYAAATFTAGAFQPLIIFSA